MLTVEVADPQIEFDKLLFQKLNSATSCLSAFLLLIRIYSVILLPSIVFMTAVSVALNVLLRDKYLAYAVSVGTSAGLFYLYSIGYTHWLYNPVLYGLWTPSDLTGAARNLTQVITHRIYCLAIATLFLSLAHLFFERKPTKGLKTGHRLSSSGWSILIIAASVAVAVITGLIIRS